MAARPRLVWGGTGDVDEKMLELGGLQCGDGWTGDAVGWGEPLLRSVLGPVVSRSSVNLTGFLTGKEEAQLRGFRN